VKRVDPKLRRELVHLTESELAAAKLHLLKTSKRPTASLVRAVVLRNSSTRACGKL
jgi:hypothetical protein